MQVQNSTWFSLSIHLLIRNQYDYGDEGTQGELKYFMAVDHRITWDSEEQNTATVLAAIMIAIFPCGVPLALFTQLYINRDSIMQRETRSGDNDLDHIGESGRHDHER